MLTLNEASTSVPCTHWSAFTPAKSSVVIPFSLRKTSHGPPVPHKPLILQQDGRFSAQVHTYAVREYIPVLVDPNVRAGLPPLLVRGLQRLVQVRVPLAAHEQAAVLARQLAPESAARSAREAALQTRGQCLELGRGDAPVATGRPDVQDLRLHRTVRVDAQPDDVHAVLAQHGQRREQRVHAREPLRMRAHLRVEEEATESRCSAADLTGVTSD